MTSIASFPRPSIITATKVMPPLLKKHYDGEMRISIIYFRQLARASRLHRILAQYRQSALIVVLKVINAITISLGRALS